MKLTDNLYHNKYIYSKITKMADTSLTKPVEDSENKMMGDEMLNQNKSQPLQSSGSKLKLDNLGSSQQIGEDKGQEKKRRKHKKRKHRRTHKHSPQYYKNLKQLKMNKKRQSHWDNRFHLEEIPSLQQKMYMNSYKKLISQQKHQLQMVLQQRKNYKTVHHNPHKEHKEKNGKAFNVRVVPSNNTKKKQEVKVKAISKTKEHQEKTKNQHMKNFKQSLKEQIEKDFTQLKFPLCHKELLVSLVDNCHESKLKGVENAVRNELKKIREKKSMCNQVDTAIAQREKIILQLQQAGEQKKQGEKIEQYRSCTIFTIQSILKWRQAAEQLYQMYTKIKRVFKYYNDTSERNYLFKIWGDFSNMPKFCNKNGQNNPFLIGYQGAQANAEDIVKIRACQLLLLEEIIKDSSANPKNPEKQNYKDQISKPQESVKEQKVQKSQEIQQKPQETPQKPQEIQQKSQEIQQKENTQQKQGPTQDKKDGTGPNQVEKSEKEAEAHKQEQVSGKQNENQLGADQNKL